MKIAIIGASCGIGAKKQELSFKVPIYFVESMTMKHLLYLRDSILK
jgi:hypothetical protein